VVRDARIPSAIDGKASPQALSQLDTIHLVSMRLLASEEVSPSESILIYSPENLIDS